MSDLVLSLFPGIGMLDAAFEAEGFCVVRGPDLLWGGDVRTFHPPPGVFAGVIGGPPCKAHSPLVNLVRATHGEAAVAPDLIPEYVRIVSEAVPTWFIMENVPRAPLPNVPGWIVNAQLLNNRDFGQEQNRVRRISYGTRDGRSLPVQTCSVQAAHCEPTVTATSGGRRAKPTQDRNGRWRGRKGDSDDARMGGGRTLIRMCELQGLPADFADDLPFTVQGKREVIGNGVPLAMGRAIAAAVMRA